MCLFVEQNNKQLPRSWWNNQPNIKTTSLAQLVTLKLAADIEWVQRVAVAIVLSDYKTERCDMSYSMALVTLGLESMDVRRDRLCKTLQRKLWSQGILIFFSWTPQEISLILSVPAPTLKDSMTLPWTTWQACLMKIKEVTANIENLTCNYWTMDVQLSLCFVHTWWT